MYASLCNVLSSPLKENVEHLLGTGETAVRGEEDVEVGRVDLSAILRHRQVLDEAVERAEADDLHLLQTPLLDGALVVLVGVLHSNRHSSAQDTTIHVHVQDQ